MSGVNKVILLGRLGKDPELKNANGLAICSFSLATSKEWKDDSGEKQQRTQWHDIVCFKKTAEIAAKYLAKGRQCFVEGEIQTRSWEDKETGVKKYRTEIIAQSIQFVGDKPTESVAETFAPQPDLGPTDVDNIPF